MNRRKRLALRTLFAVPVAGALAFGASQALASPAGYARAPDCEGFCAQNTGYCVSNPTYWKCEYCRCVVDR